MARKVDPITGRIPSRPFKVLKRRQGI